jgi:hypothetical protein
MRTASIGHLDRVGPVTARAMFARWELLAGIRRAGDPARPGEPPTSPPTVPGPNPQPPQKPMEEPSLPRPPVPPSPNPQASLRR